MSPKEKQIRTTVLTEILKSSFNIEIPKLDIILDILNSWDDTIALDLKQFENIQRIEDKVYSHDSTITYIYYEARIPVFNTATLVQEFGLKYENAQFVYIVISGESWAIHPLKDLAYLQIHEGDEEMEYTEIFKLSINKEASEFKLIE